MMQRLIKAAIEDDTYAEYQCLISTPILSGLSCLDIASLNTLGGIPTSNYSEYTALIPGNMIQSADLYGGMCETLSTGDGLINAHDLSVLMWSYFQEPPYENVNITTPTVTARPDAQGLCAHTTTNNLSRADYLNHVTTSPCDIFNVSEEGRRLGVYATPGMNLQVMYHAGNSLTGTWSRIELGDTTSLPISMDLSLVGIEHAPLQGFFSNEPPPVYNCTSCEPEWSPDMVTVTFERMTTNKGECAIVVGTSNIPVYGGTISLRQQPPARACPLRLFVWVPPDTTGIKRKSKQRIPDDACNGDLGVKSGSSAMIANSIHGGAVQHELVCSKLYSQEETYVASTGSSWLPITIFAVCTSILVLGALVWVGRTFLSIDIVDIEEAASEEQDMRV
jgi:hypothetical protein